MPPDDAASRQDVDRLSKSVEELTRTIKDLPDKMASLYVHQDLYDKDQIIHNNTHIEQAKDINGLLNIVKVVIGFVFAGVGGALLAVIIK